VELAYSPSSIPDVEVNDSCWDKQTHNLNQSHGHTAISNAKSEEILQVECKLTYDASSSVIMGPVVCTKPVNFTRHPLTLIMSPSNQMARNRRPQ